MIVPTGIGCPIGGHAGDATPAAKLLASVCDELIVHPNVVNASDVNEMPANALYVDGYALDQFLAGHVALRRVTYGSNRILLCTNKPTPLETVNAANAARATIGATIEIMELERPLIMLGGYAPGEVGAAARGSYEGVDEAVLQIRERGDDYDAVAISTRIIVDRETAEAYLRGGKDVNPWGYVESLVSRKISEELDVPVAHAPVEGLDMREWNEVVDPRRAAEVVSVAYLHCVLKGLHRAPRLVPAYQKRFGDLMCYDIDALVSPAMCWGPPHEACVAAGIEIITVAENLPVVVTGAGGRSSTTPVSNYLEAAGILAARKAGVSLESVRRPLRPVGFTPPTTLRTRPPTPSPEERRP